MGLGERCDEIVRLIDETLAAYGAHPADAIPSPQAPAVAPFPPRRARPDRPASDF